MENIIIIVIVLLASLHGSNVPDILLQKRMYNTNPPVQKQEDFLYFCIS